MPYFTCKVLKEVLSSSPSRQSDPDFRSTRESILQVRYITKSMFRISVVNTEIINVLFHIPYLYACFVDLSKNLLRLEQKLSDIESLQEHLCLLLYHCKRVGTRNSNSNEG